MAPAKSEWDISMKHPFWKEAAQRYDKVRWVKPTNIPPKWIDIASYAATNKMGTDAVYLARVSVDAVVKAQEEAC